MRLSRALALAWLTFGLALLGCGRDDAPSGAAPAPGATAPPNIVLIVADDLGWSDIGCYGGEIATPHLDRLADEGLRFTQFYNNAKCRPTRMSVETGRYPGRPSENMLEGAVTLPRLLQRAGYQTTLSGKWHLGESAPYRPRDCGYDEFYGLLDGACNYFDPALPDPPSRRSTRHHFVHNEVRLEPFAEDFYATDAITDHAVENIRRMAAAGRPFFLNLSYTAPHYPLQAPPNDIARYAGAYADGWDVVRERRYRRLLELGLIDPAWTLPPREPEIPAWEQAEDRATETERMEIYAAMVDRMDQGIGRVLAALDETGVAGRTLVLFLSDNGACAEIFDDEAHGAAAGSKASYLSCGPGWANAQNTPFRRYKQYMHEGGIATPLLVRWPGVVTAGAITHELGHVIDLMPTFLELAGAGSPTDTLEGTSLLPVLQGGTRAGPESLCWDLFGNSAARRGRWKLVWEIGSSRWELYDLQADRTETHDLAAERPELVEELRELWWRWALRVGAMSERPADSHK